MGECTRQIPRGHKLPKQMYGTNMHDHVPPTTNYLSQTTKRILTLLTKEKKEKKKKTMEKSMKISP